MNHHKLWVALSLIALLAAPTWAAVTAEEAKQLGTTLTEFGAEKAGNADGSIPAYTGGIKSIVKSLPKEFVPASGRYPDPFKDEKPLLTIDAKNMAQYAANLTEGTKALMQRFPTFRIDVYPTHRTMSYPDWVLKNTVKNATSAKLVGTSEGDGVEGAYGGIPFPIPKNGYEVVWNHFLRYIGTSWDGRFLNTLIDSSGQYTMAADSRVRMANLYYDPKASKMSDIWYQLQYTDVYDPPVQVGIKLLSKYSTNYSEADKTSWFYFPGQRRVRVAPEVSYDTPTVVSSGAFNDDEVQLFNGRPDRFDFELRGKKEIYVPYNTYRFAFAPEIEVHGKQHVNPDDLRWEKHRVWVVEQKLKPGKRHVFLHRTLYVDEDTWMIVWADGYDHGDKLYRVSYQAPFFPYDSGVGMAWTTVYYDLSKNYYSTSVQFGLPSSYVHTYEQMQDHSFMTPDAMAGKGVR
jgi:hypothetical protein